MAATVKSSSDLEVTTGYLNGDSVKISIPNPQDNITATEIETAFAESFWTNGGVKQSLLVSDNKVSGDLVFSPLRELTLVERVDKNTVRDEWIPA